MKDADSSATHPPACYRVSKGVARFINHQCVRTRLLHGERLPNRGPAIIAVTHQSHLEPVFVSLHTRALIHWMTRIEFYQTSWARRMLDAHLAFPVNRQGPCIGTIRRALRLLAAGGVIGLFPEGGVVGGAQAAIRGGSIKLGACLIAQHSRAPIIPVVIAGTHLLNAVPPWLPFRRAQLWMSVGEPILPEPSHETPRCLRAALGRRLSDSFQALYRELLDQTDLDPELAR